MKKYFLIFVFSLLSLLFLSPLNTYAASVSTYGIEYCVQNNITTLCNTGTNGSFNYAYSNNRVNHISFLTFNTNHDINVSAGDTVTLSALFWVTNDTINNLTEVYDLGPQLYGATANDFDIISIEPVDMTNTIFWSQNSQLDYYDISYQHLYIIRLQAKNNITREYWRLRWDIDLSYSTTASGTYRFRVNVSTGSPSNDYLILQAIQGISNSQNQTTDAINNMNDNINDSSTDGANTKGSNFFANFGNHDNAHLSTILTAPLRLFSAMQTECTQPINIPIGFDNSTNGAIPTRNISIDCYANFWNREDVQTFRTFWNLLIGGPCIYGLLVLLMKVYNQALDPLSDSLYTIEMHSSSKVSKKEGSEEKV